MPLQCNFVFIYVLWCIAEIKEKFCAFHFLASIMSDVEAQEHYDRFFEDVFLEMEEKVELEDN